MDHLSYDNRFVLAYRVCPRAKLSVDVGLLEMVGVGYLYVANTYPRELYGEIASQPAATGNPNSRVSQLLLRLMLLLSINPQKTVIANEAFPVEVFVSIALKRDYSWFLLQHRIVLPLTVAVQGDRA